MNTIRRTSRTTRRGFTLLEMMVTITILVVFASITVPRLFGNQKREFDVFVEQMSDLLMMFAQRDNLSTQAVGIVMNKDKQQIYLQLLLPNEQDNSLPPTWTFDKYVRPVSIPAFIGIEGVRFYEDGREIDITDWPLTSPANGQRPDVRVTIETRELSTTLQLTPHDVLPKRVGEGTEVDELRVPIDLDKEGRDTDPW
ncbi:MAG: prepilin-type N-terminal cleavage/methylation domain-containing protein [Phycisphaerales bacterium]|nr:prepilin-type N-terminal cleavage/methylation domain-containing protein [Phycisphaerales bacterium]